MKFNLKGLNLNMLLLVAILVGVLVVFLRQNNKCMMDDDVEDIEEGFRERRNFRRHNNLNIGLYAGLQMGPIRLKNTKEDFKKCMKDTHCIGVQKETSKSLGRTTYFDLYVGDTTRIGDINNFINWIKKQDTYKDTSATLWTKNNTNILNIEKR